MCIRDSVCMYMPIPVCMCRYMHTWHISHVCIYLHCYLVSDSSAHHFLIEAVTTTDVEVSFTLCAKASRAYFWYKNRWSHIWITPREQYVPSTNKDACLSCACMYVYSSNPVCVLWYLSLKLVPPHPHGHGWVPGHVSCEIPWSSHLFLFSIPLPLSI